MKQLKVSALCALTILLFHAGVAKANDPVATFESMRVVHDVEVNGQKGMRIHAAFTVKYGRGTPCRMIAYFYYDDNPETPLKSDDAQYRDAGGNMSVHTRFTPNFESSHFGDLQIFVPYSALHRATVPSRGTGTYHLKFFLRLYDESGKRFFARSDWTKFNYTAR